jgi:two-component system NtrC family sensor kinase
MLRAGTLPPDERESVEVIKSEAARASQVVKDLLAFARRSDPQRELVDLNDLVERTVRLHAYQLASGRYTVELDLSPQIPSAMGDPRQLQQVLLNLVTNSIQAMAATGGEGRLRVKTEVQGNSVVLEVSDTGPGIPGPARAHIFEPFFTTKPEGQGTGLGLSVSYGIVAAHGGTLALAESTSAGTKFVVTLPAGRASAAGAPVNAKPAPVLPPPSPLAGARLLFVDDEPALRAVVDAFGRQRGFSVVTADSGRAGLEALRGATIDAIVCDLRMPGMDGLAFYQALARDWPTLAARTVFVTGDMMGDTLRLSDNVHQPLLTKPFGFEQLEEAVVGVMKAKAKG